MERVAKAKGDLSLVALHSSGGSGKARVIRAIQGKRSQEARQIRAKAERNRARVREAAI